MLQHGFLRVASAVPHIRVADCSHNAARILELVGGAEREAVHVLVFPELVLTGYTCGDLFQQSALLEAAREALQHVARVSGELFSGITVVGVPLVAGDQLFNCAAVLKAGRILGIVPKTFIPNYKEFYEARWFASGATVRGRHLSFDEETVPFGTDLLFVCEDCAGLIIGVEICEDLWVPVPPSSLQALEGASVLLNLSASNEVIGKALYRRQLVVSQSARCLATYVYASCGKGESTTDVVFGGHCLIAENGTLLAESTRFARYQTLLSADTDLDRLRADRLRANSFGDASMILGPRREFRRLSFVMAPSSSTASPRKLPAHELKRRVDAHPFVPAGRELLRERCEEIFNTQVAGLSARLEHIGVPTVTIGVSGGLDSALALLVACKTMDGLEVSREQIHALTLPGFGTTNRTLTNARALMQELAVAGSEVNIRGLCFEEMRLLGRRPFGIDLTGLDVERFTALLQQRTAASGDDLVFENVQARMRTNILMNRGFVIGTGDLSELALGWCTYNADHMSMYNPNAGIPKTLVKFLVRWAAEHEFDGEARRLLLDIVATQISPELLPVGSDGLPVQSTETIVGPYELHDFFLYHFLRHGAPPEKILFLARHAHFTAPYTLEEQQRWLRVFIERFFANQFKRSCLPDGPKVGSVSLSPRGDWRMPSDADKSVWLQWLDRDGAPTSELFSARPAGAH